MARTNLCPNPSLINDATDWFGGGTRVTGSTGMQRTTAYQNAGVTTTLPRGSVTAGLTYRFSAFIKGTGGASSGNANINWYSGGSYLSSAPGQGWTVTTGNVTRIESGAQVAPAGADQALLNITGVDAQIQVTCVLYEQTSQLFEFFDGNSADCSWTGTAGSSTSTNPVGDSGGDEPPPDTGGGGSDEAGVTQGWGTPLYSTDFNDPSEIIESNGIWGLYDGPGHDNNGTRDPERISITGGLLRLQGTAGISTGGMAHQFSQRYGRWEARARAYSTGGTNGQNQYHPVLIVWPTGDNWPDDGEYDFWEVFVGDSGAGAFIHYPHPNLPVQQEHATKAGVNPADWHNYAIDWQPDGITGYIDGVQWYHYSGGAGPAGRSNIQDMPLGHLTIQLDAFDDTNMRPASMDIDWMRVWDNESVAGDGEIGPVGIESPNQGGYFGFGVPLMGNRFRLYFTNTSAGVTTSPNTLWESTGSAVTGKSLGQNRGGANAAVTVSETSTSNVFDVMHGQWISPPFTSSGVVQGGYQLTTARSETDTAADFLQHVMVRVVSGDGTVERGTLSRAASVGELSTTLTAILLNIDGSITTPVAAQAGDRLVVELGIRATNTVTTSYSSTLRYGGTAGDVEGGDTTNLTTNSGWIQFADAGFKALFFGQTVTGTGIASAEAVGGALVTLPPTLGLTIPSIATAEAVGAAVVTAQAAIIAPEGIDGGAFGDLSISNAVVVPSIDTAEAFGSLRVRRLSDIDLDAGIASAEAFGAVVLVHFEELLPLGIDSAEFFGDTNVEDPHRGFTPFSFLGGEEFGIPVVAARARTFSVESAEAFGLPKLAVGFWKMVQPTRIERWRLGDGTSNVIYVTNVVGLTVYGDDDGLFTIENPKTEQLDGAKYVWQGGHDNITTDQAIRDLWLANGYQVEMSF
jgi:Glycosyl hydrolases family 16